MEMKNIFIFNFRKLPETPDEWRGRASPVHVFPRFQFSNGTTRCQLFENDSAFLAQVRFLKMTRLLKRRQK
jgi:hypothetical protein